MSKKLIKLVSVMICILLAASIFSGCSEEKNLKESGTDASKADIRETAEITFSQWISGQQGEKQEEVYKRILADFEKKTGVKVTHTLLPEQQYKTWLTTQFAAGSAPDLIKTQISTAWQDFNKGYIADLTPELDKENPYITGRKWRDTFSPTLLEQSVDPTNNKVSMVPTNTVVVRIFYNKDLFTKAGITEIPKTWKSFLEVQKKLKDAKILPFAFANSKSADNHYLWFTNSLTGQLDSALVPQIDVDKSGLGLKNEIAMAFDKGIVNFEETPYKDVFEIIKDWSQYWNSDFNSTDSKAATQMWLRGEAAMTMIGSFDLVAVEQMEGRNFEYGVMPVPAVTKDSNANASGKSVVLGGKAADGYCINKNIKDEKYNAALDLCRYILSPEVAKILADEMYVISSLSGVKISDKLEGFQITANEDVIKVNYYAPSTIQEFNDFYFRAGQLYLKGEVDVKSYTAEMNKEFKKGMDLAKQANNWTEENGYGTKK